MRKLLLPILIIALNINASDQREIDALLDGLHKDAHEGSFQSYFARYSPNAIFLGTDKTERWTCLLYTSPSPRDVEESRMPSSA